jgi:hypothetical protein
MPNTPAPAGFEPPSAKRIAIGAFIAAVVAIIVLVTAVLPAEYGRDPTGIGAALGFTRLSSGPTRTIEIADTIGGNETVRDVEIPDAGEPVPLPNPNIHQEESTAPRTETLSIVIPPESETEIKTVLRPNKVIVYTWQTDGDPIYSDFHGHNPEYGSEFFVRYSEHQEATGSNGSLVAPFEGEHGWYWLNFNAEPVTVTLTVTGYFDDVINYGIF